MKFLNIIIIAIICCALAGCSSRVKKGTDPTVFEEDIHDESEEAHSLETDHTVITIKKQAFSVIVKTGGRIMVDSKDIEIITAKSSGIVKFIDHFLFPGVRINRDQPLFTISGDRLADDNSELNYIQAKADLEMATLNYERAKKMITERIITEEHYLELKNVYEKALNEFNNLNAAFGKDGNSISSPDNGYIREVYITEGQKVTSGQSLASIVIEHNIVLKADISPDYLDMLPYIENANFKVGYSNHIYKTKDMGGKKISYGKSTGGNSFYIPVYFRMKYIPELIEGTFAEVYLVGQEIPDAIVVPNSALLEEFGKYYVYVEDFDGDFIKRYVSTSFSNGEETLITAGLAEDETIVATGAYQVKLSQMTTSAPAHNH